MAVTMEVLAFKRQYFTWWFPSFFLSGSSCKHLSSYAAGVQENFLIEPDIACPCSTGSTQQPPSAVGNDYFCESGAAGNYNQNTFL